LPVAKVSYMKLAMGSNISKLRETRKNVKKILYKKQLKGKTVISGRIVMEQSKKCCKCKVTKLLICFGKLTNTRDGLRYDCKDCRKDYSDIHKKEIKIKQHEFYEKNKTELLIKNKEYRKNNIDTINIQRKEYRSKPEVKEHNNIWRNNKIKSDLRYRLRSLTQTRIKNCLKHNKLKSTVDYLGCDIEYLKYWLEFQFDKNMNWNNLGSYWEIDHILPVSIFNFEHENNINICFHWTNLQPLEKIENRQKSDNLLLHYYFNNIINVNRFNTHYTQYLGYQAVNESLQWLRIELGYGKNPPYDDVVTTSEIGNPQPSL